ncbi:hypothetical protein HRH25_04005 [Flavisolibacter sp. BT320]|nr:hypothetical protein [Flavisolibacter longurius]
MTLKEFSKLKKDEQIHVIKQRGTFLFLRHEGCVDVVLYQINGFYAEVFFEGAARKNLRIHCFDNTEALDIYLNEISLASVNAILSR